MTSSMVTGDRRWAPQRRGGMTVLGKVAVPKPVNLPSQRLENHGLDPNVEIVPKGTLSWGSRASSTPNAWASSALSSPITDSSAGSTGVNGRPSSGGSGARPSTSSSDRSLEPASNAWGSSSRPSSASGILASSQTSMVTARPRSAEPRPGSSQLSRFAETVSENSTPWSATGTAEKLGAASSKINGFSLSSGDFPSLGSEKSSELQPQQGHSSHGRPSTASGGRGTQKEMIEGHSSHGRPSSASGGLARQKERLEVPRIEEESSHANTGRGAVDTWQRDNPHSVGDERQVNVEKWHRDPQKNLPYPHSNLPPHQFDTWHGHPVQSPMERAWYRPLPPGTYAPRGVPGGYPIVDQFPYYPPQPIPRPGGPGGFHPKNGEAFHPRVPDSHVVHNLPVMPVRPGGYPSPLPYDGYYGPPHGSFSNPNEQDAPPFTGIGPHRGAYNYYPNQTPGNVHAKPGGYTASVDKEYGHAKEASRGPYKVLLKQHDNWGDDDSEDKKEHPAKSDVGSSVRVDDLGSACGKNERMEIYDPASGEKASSQSSSCGGEHNKGLLNDKVADDTLVKNPEKAALLPCPQQHPVVKKDATLIEKIESLNAKARMADGRYDAVLGSAREETTKRTRVVNAKVDHSTREVGNSNIANRKVTPSGVGNSPSKVDASNIDKSSEFRNSEMSILKPPETHAHAIGSLNSSESGEKVHTHVHKSTPGLQGWNFQSRLDSHGDKWKNRSPRRDNSTLTRTLVETQPDMQVQDSRTSERVPEQELHLVGKIGGEPYMSSTMDSNDLKAQRAKMKEIAAQRAKQLQKEEEERTREQKAKALAKLEELNRRTMVESSKSDQSLIGVVVQHKEDEFTDSAVFHNTFTGPAQSYSSGFSSSGTAAQMGGNGAARAVESSGSSTNVSLEDLNGSPENPLASQKEAEKVEAMSQKTYLQSQESGAHKQKQMDYKKRQIVSQEKIVGERSAHTTGVVRGVNNDGASNTINALAFDSLPVNPKQTEEPVMQHKKKHNRNVKNKQSLDEVSSGVASQLSLAIETNIEKSTMQSSKLEPAELVAQSIVVLDQTKKETSVTGDVFGAPSADQGLSQLSEAHGRVTNQLKPQTQRKTTRNPQSVRTSDNFHGNEAVWAPVRPVNKTESSEEAIQISSADVTEQVSGKNGHNLQGVVRNKRAEMERYVPKHVVAKESSQQGTSQQPLPSPITHSVPGKTTVVVDNSTADSQSGVIDGSASGKAGFAVEAKNGGNNKHHRHGRGPGLWRQRSSTEPNSVPRNLSEESSPSDISNNVQKHVDQSEPPKPEVQPLEQQPGYYNNWDDDVSMPSEPVPVPIIVKDHNTASRGRRQPYKGQRGQYHAPAASNDYQSEPSDRVVSQSQVENQTINEQMRSHWQPKPRAYPNHHRQGNRGNGGQKNAPQLGLDQPPHLNERINDAPAQSETQKTRVADVPNSRNQELRREMKRHTEQARPQMQDLPTMSEPRHEPPVPLGMRRHGQGTRFNRGQEGPLNGGRREVGQDVNEKQNALSNGDNRQKHHAHYEYQPVGSYNTNNIKANESVQQSLAPGDEVSEASRPMVPRNHDRGQGYIRRGGGGGNFNGRNSKPSP
ncbi:Protein MODIFIER OF SNC1 1 [Acorus calamus]|uniref:Protein MODIFIER OF SNC1 1 n=1 Tax=Acorus calamus TaxID=4465 RepID=A0AAV9DA91_ACOCL|nr:Protein MODIFIER OF SNC1 1 [Acorus calamus]